jgi:hypothetical protein
MHMDDNLAKREEFVQTENHIVIDFLSQYSLGRIKALSNSENQFNDKEIIHLSMKKYKGRPSKVNSIADKDFVSFNNIHNCLKTLFDDSLDLVLPSISKFQNSKNPPFLTGKSSEIEKQTSQDDLGFLIINENHTIPRNYFESSVKNKLFFFKNRLLSSLSKEELLLIQDSFIQFRGKGFVKWPSSSYISILLYFQRRLIDIPIVTETVSIDYMNFLIFTSKTQPNIFVILSFAISIFSRFITAIQYEFLLHYCSFCFSALSIGSYEYPNIYDLTRVDFNQSNGFEIITPDFSKNLIGLTSDFAMYFENQFENFLAVISKDNPEIIFSAIVYKDFLDSLRFREFLYQADKLFQLNS